MEKSYIKWFNNFLYSFLPKEKYSSDFYKESDKLYIPPVLGKYNIKLGKYDSRLLELYAYFISTININVLYNNQSNISYFGQEYTIDTTLNILGQLEKIKGIKLNVSSPELIQSIKIKYENLESNEILSPTENELIFSFTEDILVFSNTLNFQILIVTKNSIGFNKIIYSPNFSILQMDEYSIEPNNFILYIDNQPPQDVIAAVGHRLSGFLTQLTFYNPNKEESNIIIFRSESSSELILERKEYALNESIDNWTVIFKGDNNDYLVKDNVTDNIPYYYKIFTYDSFYNYSTGVNVLVDKFLDFGITCNLLEYANNITVGSGDTIDLFSLSISATYLINILQLKIDISQDVISSIKIYEDNVLKEIINNVTIGNNYYDVSSLTLNTSVKTLKFVATIKSEESLNEGVFNSLVKLTEIKTNIQPQSFDDIIASFTADNYIYPTINVTSSINGNTVSINIDYSSQEADIKYVILKSTTSSTLTKSDIEDLELQVGSNVSNNWTVVYLNTVSSFSESIEENIKYYYAIAAVDKYFNYTDVVIKTVYIDTIPPNPVENLICNRFDATNSFISFEYNNISEDAYKILIFRSLSNTSPVLQNGVDYTNTTIENYDLIYSTSTIISSYNINDSNVPTIEKYYYYVVVVDTSFNYSNIVSNNIEEMTESFEPVVFIYYDPSTEKHYVTFSKNNKVILEEVTVV